MLKNVVMSLLLLAGSCSSHAGLISADLFTAADLPEYSEDGALTYQVLDSVFGAGVELNADDFLANPSGWLGGEVWLDYDPLTNILTLLSQDIMDFQTFDVWLSNIVFAETGQVISGFSVLSNNLINNAVQPVLAFTANSLHISYRYDPVFNFTGGQASFLVQMANQPQAIPAPATLAIFMLALAGLGIFGRRAKF